jgi:hypothetical protein
LAEKRCTVVDLLTRAGFEITDVDVFYEEGDEIRSC